MVETTGSNQVTHVSVIDISMPFGSMVTFMIKWSIAAIPALLLLGTAGLIIGIVIGSFRAVMP